MSSELYVLGVSVQVVSDRGLYVLGVSVLGVHVRGIFVLSPSIHDRHKVFFQHSRY